MKYRALFFIPLLLAFLSCQKKQPEAFLDLREFNWTLSSPDTSIVLHNTDPSDVHLSLLNAEIISDPFYRDNEKKLQWVGEKTWKFKTSFDVPPKLLNHDYIEIVFEGLDTYADVTLNDSLVLTADNMFRTWHINVANLLMSESNILEIVFYPPEKIRNSPQADLNYFLPDKRGITRKAAYQFGWDWGPEFITTGVWKPAYIRAWSGAEIRNVYARYQGIKEDTARVMLEIDIDSKLAGEYTLQVDFDEAFYTEFETILSSGSDKQWVTTKIADPKLWWPAGYGEQNRYEISIKLLDKNGIIDDYSLKIGLREIELIQEVDSVGRSFYFMVNGIPVFAKGANLVPMDNFLPRVKNEDYLRLIKNMKASNINMLRVWGGGIYQHDVFYDLCDEYGIMVWQDFMFACNLYPGDSLFVQNVTYEAIDNIKRIRNHPSLVLWCGNNEIDEAWNNWGWQQQYGYNIEDSIKIWHDYLYLFEELLPDLVEEYNHAVPYWPSSPSNGWGREIAYKEGDVHYWGVWWGREPFEIYDEKVGRFMSEYGFQAMPDLRTIQEFTWPEDRSLNSEIMNVHQKHPFGWEAINEYMLRDYKVPQFFDDYVYVSQLLQAKGVSAAIEAHRRAKPYCMGTLYWQANDCWPVTSWSGIDYYGRWKAMQYHVKKAYEAFLISAKEKGDSINIYIVSDTIVDVDASLIWNIIDFNGNVIKEGREEVKIEGNSSAIYKKIEKDAIHKIRPTILLTAELVKGKKNLASAIYYFEKPKSLALKPADIKMNIEDKTNRFEITLTSETLAKSVALYTDMNGFFSDNYFDLIPGKEKTLNFTPDNGLGEIPNIEIKCLNNIY